jgi:hypothetical protein
MVKRAASLRRESAFELSRSGEKIPGNKNTCQGQEGFVNVGSLFVANSKPPKLIEPSNAPLYDPAPSPQSAAVPCIALCKQRHNATLAKTLPDCLRVITTVAYNTIRPITWPPARSLQRLDGVYERKCLL